jgi:hypothetical protein
MEKFAPRLPSSRKTPAWHWSSQESSVSPPRIIMHMPCLHDNTDAISGARRTYQRSVESTPHLGAANRLNDADLESTTCHQNATRHAFAKNGEKLARKEVDI